MHAHVRVQEPFDMLPRDQVLVECRRVQDDVPIDKLCFLVVGCFIVKLLTAHSLLANPRLQRFCNLGQARRMH